jgi:hypothetical protein
MKTTHLFSRLLWIFTLAAPVAVSDAAEKPPAVVICPANSSPLMTLAAHEAQRYVYLRTGQLLPIEKRQPRQGNRIILGIDPALGREQFRLRGSSPGAGRTLEITGGSDRATLYGVYRFAETLGIRFHLHGDSIPDDRTPLVLPDIEEAHSPLFDTRGIQPFHDFTEGPDWWTADDYKAYLAQMAKMRMNLMALHCYPEGGVGPEPLVWIGPPEDVNNDGTVKVSYPSRWASTSGGSWGYAPAKSSEFSAGAGLLFPGDDYGSPITDGFRPKPAVPQDCNAVFNRAGAFYKDLFGFGQALGVRACIGTETPLHLPKEVAERLKAKGLDPKAPSTPRLLYEGMFKRIARTHPLDFYWLWTPEDWTWSGNKPGQLEGSLADMRAALDALEQLGRPFTLATCGWVLGPQQDRAALDRHLPKTSPISCINREVGFGFVETAFSRTENRPQWAIPWMEDDPNMVGVQLWAGRTRRDAADAHAYGCTGLLGIHWRTRVLAPNFAALSQAAWSQKPWNPEAGSRIKVTRRDADVHVGGKVAAYPKSAIEGTEMDALYQDCRYDVDAYRVKVPNGVFQVTLQWCEVAYDAKGKRVFGVSVQGQPVVEHLDVFERAGKNKAFDLMLTNVAVTNGQLVIDFTREVELPFLAGLVIEGRTGPEGAPTFTRKINCGGPAWRDYEADLGDAEESPRQPGRPRDLPCEDLYADWAVAEFGPEVGPEAARLFASLDGGQGDYSAKKELTRLPRPSDWIGGPGGIKPNSTPWQQEQPRYAFVQQFETLRSRVRGTGRLDRFDYWLNTFKYHRALGQLGCARGQLDAVMKRIEGTKDEAAQQRLTREEALPLRLALARQWETMMTILLQAVSTPGEMGTVANLEQHTLRNTHEPHFMELHDAKLVAWGKAPLPPEAQPTRDYKGPARLVVPTVRTVATAGERVTLNAIVLDRQPARRVTVHWRPLGEGRFRTAAARHIGRAVYAVSLPAIKTASLEYYLEAETATGKPLLWPATAPQFNQTLVPFAPAASARR